MGDQAAWRESGRGDGITGSRSTGMEGQVTVEQGARVRLPMTPRVIADKFKATLQ